MNLQEPGPMYCNCDNCNCAGPTCSHCKGLVKGAEVTDYLFSHKGWFVAYPFRPPLNSLKAAVNNK